ncbi:MAG: thioredoxin domain-containing protein [Mariprofundales bacterium]|nr:thioredoxin domain-containing protein [Mariprofundales bacterium]
MTAWQTISVVTMLLWSGGAAIAADNHLSGESSPYLQQHLHNPVDWYPWGDAAFARAKKEDKLILLSIGYSTCHWCHVMEHESFESQEVGDALNATFVSIKVDREERPDIDAIYMRVAQMLNGGGGWPLNVILTPDLKPLYAATYLPKESRFGRVGLLELTAKMDRLWHHDRARLLASADEIARSVRRPAVISGGESTLSAGLLERAVEQLTEEFDSLHGGFGGAPKFPSPHRLLFLLRMNRTAMVEQTLDAMRNGGIFDQIGFGFHRYSTDDHWLVPHFEKMLYDQAMLMLAYSECYAATGHRRHARVVMEIAEFVAREMSDSSGALYSALDADSVGGEGRFYQWTTAEIRDALGDEEAPFAAVTWGVERRGNYLDEAKRLRNQRNILFVNQPPLDVDRERLERVRRKLLAARSLRTAPFRDDKVLTDWNGMMIAALAYSARTLCGDEGAVLLKQAQRAAHSLLERSWDGTRLLHSWRGGVGSIDGHLDDYAALTWGLIELYQSSFDPEWLQQAVAINRVMLATFAVPTGGFYLTSERSDLLTRPQEWFDGAVPSGNSIAVMNLLRLSHLTGDTALAEQAERALKQGAAMMRQAAGGSSYLLSALYLALKPVQELVLVGDRDGSEAEKMVQVAYSGYHPNMVIVWRDRRLFATAPFLQEQRAVEGKSTAYLCENFVCNRPVTTAAALAALLNHH